MKRSYFVIAISAVAWILLGPISRSLAEDDWPQWRGPDRTGVSADFEAPGTWPEALELAWATEVGPGNSSPVVSQNRVYAFVRDAEGEALVALELSTGDEIWRQSYTQAFEPLTIVGRHDKGPFSTPTVSDGRVFTFGIREVLTAWNAETGERLWQREFSDDFERPQPFYGASQSPLVLSDRLIVHLGGPGEGALAAFDPASGSELWRTKTDDGPAYGSPIQIEVGGHRQVATLTQRRFIGFDPENGELLWETPFRVSFDTTSVTPLVYQDLLIVSGDKVPMTAYRLSKNNAQWSIDEVWTASEAATQFSSPVLVGDRLFAFSVRNKGQLVCVDPRSGELIWSGPPRQGENAYLIAGGGAVLAVYEDAEMEVFDPNADELRVLAKYTVGDDWMWAHPALFGHHLLIKDHDHLRLWRVLPAKAEG